MWVDDGTEEVKVYLKRGTGIRTDLFELGDLVEIAGIVSQTRSGYQLLPRSQTDIVKTGVAEAAVRIIEASEDASQKEVTEKYLTATAGGLTSLLFGLVAKAHGGMAKNAMRRISRIAITFLRKQ